MSSKFIVTEQYVDYRLDKLLSLISEFSRTHIESMIKEEKVLVNNKIAKGSYRVRLNDLIEYEDLETTKSSIEGENIPLDIVYEDDDLLVINKPRGLVVHPGNGHHNGTLVNAILGYCHNLSGINGVERPGIVHRIDKDTSGLIVVCKNDFTHVEIAKQLASHSMHREYIALVKGVIKEDDGKIIAPIGRDRYDRLKMAVDTKNGKEAITYFHVERRYNQYTLVTCKLETGRTHQIRVHMNYIGYPLEGDPLYGKKKSLLFNEGQLLHAYQITFIHPRLNKEMTFKVDLPNDFKNVLKRLEN